MPSAHATLFFLATFLALWGLSLVIRGSIRNKAKARRLCPACDTPIADKQSRTCPGCGHAAASEQELLRPRRSPALIAAGVVAILAAAGSAYCGNYVAIWATGRSPTLIQFTLWNSIAAGLALFWSGLFVWAWRGERSRGRKRCPRCWYDMQGATALLCPECGHEPASPRDLFRPRRRRKLAAIALVALLSAPAAWLWPRYEKYGPIGLIPTTVLIAGFDTLPEPLIFQNRWIIPGGGRAKPLGSLSDRIREDGLWKWQARWLDARVRRIWMTSTDYKMLRRVTTVRYPQTTEESRRVIELAVNRLAHGDNADRLASANFILGMAGWIGLASAGDAIEPHAAALTPLTTCGVQPIEVAASLLLWNSEPRHEEVLPVIVRCARRTPPYLHLAAQALRTALVMPGGLRLLEDIADSPVVAEREILAQTLYLGPGMFGQTPDAAERAKEAEPLLRRLFNDPAPTVVLRAADNLVASQIPGAAADIMQAIRDGRAPAADLLQILASSYQVDISAYAADFLLLMSGPDVITRDRASKCLITAINQGAPFEPLRPQLESLRQSPNPDMAAYATQLLDSRPVQVP